MLAVFHGNDTVAVREHALAYALSRAGDPSAMASVASGTLTAAGLIDRAEGVSLFGETMVYMIDLSSADAAERESVTIALEAIASSMHTFVLIEGKMLAAQRKAYEKYAEAVEEYTVSGGRAFNVFAMGDALAMRDKKKLWLLLHEAFREGRSSEEIVGMLWWQLKTMRIAHVTEGAEEAGMKDFPYNKAKRALRNFKAGELAAISHALLAAYHDARLGKLELDLALERWVLSL